MRYAALKKNDIVNGESVVVSLFMQGCPHHCHGCFNPETWDPQGGKEVDINKLIAEIEDAISANGVIRNFSILGGEPFAPYNLHYTYYIVSRIREKYPNNLNEFFNKVSVGNYTTLKSELDEICVRIIDRKTKNQITIQNEYVRSEQEVEIANFLYLNNI